MFIYYDNEYVFYKHNQKIKCFPVEWASLVHQHISLWSMTTPSRYFWFPLLERCFASSLPVFTSPLWSPFSLFLCSCPVLYLLCASFLLSIYLPFTLPIRFLHWPCLLGAAWVPPSSPHCVSISLGWLSSFQHALSLYLQSSDFSNSFQKVPYDNCSVYFRRCEVLKLN